MGAGVCADLAVVDVCDDRDIADVGALLHRHLERSLWCRAEGVGVSHGLAERRARRRLQLHTRWARATNAPNAAPLRRALSARGTEWRGPTSRGAAPGRIPRTWVRPMRGEASGRNASTPPSASSARAQVFIIMPGLVSATPRRACRRSLSEGAWSSESPRAPNSRTPPNHTIAVGDPPSLHLALAVGEATRRQPWSVRRWTRE